MSLDLVESYLRNYLKVHFLYYERHKVLAEASTQVWLVLFLEIIDGELMLFALYLKET